MRILSKMTAAAVLATAAFTIIGTSAKAATISNGVYEAHIEDSGFSDGSWNAITGPSHPTGAGNDILYTGTTTTTNFSSLRIFGAGSNTDYTFAGNGGGTNLDSFVTSQGASPLAAAGQGWRTTWNVTPENLGITQDVLLVGSNYNDSAVYHTVELTNTGTSALQIGWRNLYDWEVTNPGGVQDDGPSNQIEVANGPVVIPTTTNEFSYTPGTGDFARVSTSQFTPTYQPLLGLGYDPGFLPTLLTTRPDRYDYVSWPAAYNSSYDYTVDPTMDVSDDSAGLSFFERTIAPGSSVRFTEAIFAAVPGQAPPGGGGGGTTVPEPSSILGVLAFGAFGVGSRLLRQQQQKKQAIRHN
jgi:hypothetical protein